MKEHNEWTKQQQRQAKVAVCRTLAAERQRGWGEAGPIHLLWWNWPREMHWEMVEGLDFTFASTPPSFHGDNYESADCPKFHVEFARMLELGYMEGPFEDEDESNIAIVHSCAAVEKKGTTKLRLVVDMTASGLNGALDPPRYILPTMDDVVARSYPGCWYMKMDLTDGFYCTHLKGSARKYL